MVKNANCRGLRRIWEFLPTLRGVIILPPSQPRFLARLPRWQKYTRKKLLNSDWLRKEQTRTHSLFMCFRGVRRLGVRLRRVRGVMGRNKRKIATGRFRFNMAAREESSLSRDVNNALNEGKLTCQHRSYTVNNRELKIRRRRRQLERHKNNRFN